MQGELRVTVVATGLGDTSAKPELTVVEPAVEERTPLNHAVGDDSSMPNYNDYDKPASQRMGNTAKGDAQRYVDAAVKRDMEYLDIPAFLRRQAD
jgi:cell division protein FtsZ